MSPPSLLVHYRHFNATTGQSATKADFGTFLPCSSLSAFPLTFRLLLPTFHQRACITVLPPLCRMPQCHRQVIALLVARTVRHWLLTWLETGLTFPTAAACRGFDASACTPTPRDLLSSHWQLRLHLIWKVANPLSPRGTRTGTLVHSFGSMNLSLRFLEVHIGGKGTTIMRDFCVLQFNCLECCCW